MRRQTASFTHRSTAFFSTLLGRPAPVPPPIPNPHSAQVPMESSVEEERYCYNPKLTWNPQAEQYFIKAYGAEHFARISKALTYPSCYSCIRVNTLKSNTDAVIEKLLNVLQEAEFGYSNVVSDSSKNEFVASEEIQEKNNFLKDSSGYQNSRSPTEAENNLIDQSLQGKFISKCCLPGLDYVVFVRGSGPRAIRYDAHECREPAKEVIVSRKCAEAVLRGAQVYVPGVLACSAHVEKGDIVSVSVAVEQPGPDGKWGVGMTRGIILQGLQTDPYFIQRNGLYIGQGRTMLSRAGMFRGLEGIAIDMHKRVFKLPSFNGLLEGEIFLQNLPSIITAHALDPQKGERILDMCAAPGGKTTAIAMLMMDDGEVVAADRSHNKVMDIQKLAAELGLKCITTYKLDALKSVQMRTDSNHTKAEDCIKDTDTMIPGAHMLTLPGEILSSMSNDCCTADFLTMENIGNGKVNGGAYTSKADIRKAMRRMKNGSGRNQIKGGKVEISKGFLPGSFDRVLLDAPCSALGLRPRLFTGEETLESLRKHATYQRRMFDQAVQLVRAGGVIVYSTCTINPGENEALVRYALDRYKFLSLAPQSPKIGGPGIIGTYDVDGYTEEWLRPGEEDLVQRFDPSSSLDTIGFFIAKFSVGETDT